MTRLNVVPEIIGTADALGQSQEISVRKRLIGVWKLLTVEVVAEGKVILPYGEHPIGRLTYDEAGRMSAQLMKSGRQSSVADASAVSRANEDELRHIADGYVGYYGNVHH